MGYTPKPGHSGPPALAASARGGGSWWPLAPARTLRAAVAQGALAAVLAYVVAYAIGAYCALPPLEAGAPAVDTRAVRFPLDADSAAAFAAYERRALAARYRHISLCSKPHPKFELLKQTAAWHGDTVTPLGMGDRRFQRWGVGFGVKLDQVQRWLNGPDVDPDDIVLFSDAFDVLMMAGSDEIKRKYLATLRLAMAREADPAAAAAGVPPRVPTVLFSTERYCWPDSGRAGEYPPSDRAHEFAYLNSGTYVGRAGDLAAAMATLNYTISEDDQRYWTSLYLASRGRLDMPRIVLDHESDVFLCMSGYSLGADVAYLPSTRRYKFRRTPGHPLVMHFNNAKTEIAPFFTALQGRYCPEARWSLCRLGATALPALAALALGLLAGRLLLGALLEAVRRATGRDLTLTAARCCGDDEGHVKRQAEAAGGVGHAPAALSASPQRDGGGGGGTGVMIG
jgi:hypothetical protein